jgi:hypothetical protein
MSQSSTLELNGGRLQDFTIDQLAGASALILASTGGLLLTIWKSRCACRMRIGCTDKCYIFDCERRPPPDNSSDEEDTKDTKEKKKPNKPETEPEPEPEPEKLLP